MDAFVLTEAERAFFRELEARGVRFMVVGLTAAGLQGANATTVDIDLWFETPSDSRIAQAAASAGGMFVSGFGMMPARLGGPLGDRFDVVLQMSGLGSFADEFVHSKRLSVEGVTISVLGLERILASKRAANRPKDQAAGDSCSMSWTGRTRNARPRVMSTSDASERRNLDSATAMSYT